MKNYQQGTVVIITFLILIALLLLGSYFLIFALTESRISKSQEAGLQTYYLAEAGINEAMWKLKNDDITSDGDPAWEIDFVDCAIENWTAGFSRSFANGSSYQVTIQNSVCARGKIVSTSTVSLPHGKSAQRIVKTTVFKALASPVEDSAILSGGSSENVDIKFSKLRIYNGNLFSNHNLDIKGTSIVEVYDNPNTLDDLGTPERENLEGQILAVGNFNQSSGSTLISECICAKDVCTDKCEGFPAGGCPPDSIVLPLVDFDSSSPYSFKTRAQADQDNLQCQVLCNASPCTSQPNKCIYSASEFEDLLWEVEQGGTLTLNNEITYVTGDVKLKGGRHLVINGVLVADDNIYIGKSYSWTRQGQRDEGFSQITINRPTAQSPSGILTKRKIDFGLYSSFQSINITGIVYANDEVSMISMPESFNVIGAVIARKLSLISLWQWLNITLDNDIILYGLGYRIDGQAVEPTFSPVITIDHWEESY